MMDDGRVARARQSPRPRLWPAILLILAVAAGGTALAVQRGWLDLQTIAELRVSEPTPPPAAQPVPNNSEALAARGDALTARLAQVEQRLVRVTEQAEAAAGNAARAEGLLIAFASRRAIERGTPLAFLENQLKLRFGTSQPNAVTTIIEAGANPVTLETLSQELLILTPRLSRASAGDSAWDKVRQEMGQLFIIRRDSAPSPAAPRRIERARLFLEGGNVEAAIAEVVHTPGGAARPGHGFAGHVGMLSSSARSTRSRTLRSWNPREHRPAQRPCPSRRSPSRRRRTWAQPDPTAGV